MKRRTAKKVARASGGTRRGQTTPVESNSGKGFAKLARSLGNRATQKLINSPFVQAKLEVSSPQDESEKEADRVADSVMRMPAPTARPTFEKEEEKDKLVQTKAAAPPSGGLEVEADVESRINSSKSSGSPLPDHIRSSLEPRFGTDFSDVRVHTGADANELNRDVGAKAFTHGADIYYGPGQDPSNLELTAHELTHVVQQTGAPPLGGTDSRQSSTPDSGSSVQRACDACEREEEKKPPEVSAERKEEKKPPELSAFRVQRTIGDGHDFPPASRFSGNVILEAVFDNERVLQIGSGNSGGAVAAAVTLVQQALIALGYPHLRFGADGIFGDETARAVNAFQRDVGLVADNRVGFRTIDFLDKRDRGEEVVAPVRPVVANAPFDLNNAIAQPGAAPSIPLGPLTWGLTFPENVQVGIDVFDNGGVWQPVLTQVVGNYSMQTRLIPPVVEVTGPGGNTTAANYCAQINDLNALTRNLGAFFMESAVLAHERVHARQFRPALIDPTVITPLETAIEGITIPVSLLVSNPTIAEIFIRLNPAFSAAVTAAQANWLAQILVLVANDHNPGGTCDREEHAIVDPMIRRICAFARASGFAPCPPLCP
jgi:peptidoglycan hydrolase-like protein with peptidoglycan-binding domain